MLYESIFPVLRFYKQQNELALLLVNICAAMLQIGRLFFFLFFFYYAIAAAPRQTRQLKGHGKVLNINHNVVLLLEEGLNVSMSSAGLR